jgi:hypothetical protein
MMEKEVTGVQELLGKITEEPGQPGSRILERNDQLYGMQAPSWGPQASLEAQDAGSRMGIDMGEPTNKAASLRHAILAETEALEKLALLKQVLQGGKAVAEGVGKIVKPVAKAVDDFGAKSRNWFSGRRASSREASSAARAKRNAKHVERTQNMSGPGRAVSNVANAAGEAARGGVMPAAGVGFTGLSLKDFGDQTRVVRNQAAGRTGF